MVWIKDKNNQYVNLDNVKLLYVAIHIPPNPICICYMFDDSQRNSLLEGFNSVEEAQNTLDELMKKIK